jgi:hypothetical protein
MSTESFQLESHGHEAVAFDQPTDLPPSFASEPANGLEIGLACSFVYWPANGPANGPADKSPNAVGLLISRVKKLSNYEVTRQVIQWNQRQRLIGAKLLLFLGELDSRRLYRSFACPSLFDFLVTRLGQSEDVAYRWMWGARLMRTFPLVYELLAEGRLHLSGLMLLKPHLTEENHRDWLLAAAGKSKRQIEKLVAARYPKPDVAVQVRKLVTARCPEPNVPLLGQELPAPPSDHPDAAEKHLAALGALSPFAQSLTTAPATTTTNETTAPATTTTNETTAPAATTNTTTAPTTLAVTTNNTMTAPAATTTNTTTTPAATTVRCEAAKIQPLSEFSYRVVLTASERLKAKMDRASELMSHAIVPTDLPALLERALDLLIEREERRRYGSPRSRIEFKEPSRTGSPRSRIEPKEPSRTGSPRSRIESKEPSRTGSPRSQAGATLSPKDEASSTVETGGTHSRYLPARVRRQVWERDGGRCSYVDREGRRCQSRHRLEFDHRVAYALGGTPTVDNIRLRCHQHNALAAEEVFGLKRIADAISSARERRHRAGATTGRSR